MIRHTPSFFISIIVHSLLFGMFFYTYTYVRSLPSDKSDEEICLKLQCFEPEKKKPVEEKVKPQEYTPPKIKQKIEKPKVEKPKIKERLQTIVPEPLSVPVIQEKEEEIKEDLQEIDTEAVEEEIIEPDTTVENKEVVTTQSEEEKAVAREEQYISEHIKEIVKLLSENLYYPRSARKRGIVGKVLVKFSLSSDATVSSIEVLSSKSEILSRAAIKTIEDLSGEFPKPHEELILHVPIEYELSQ